MRVASFLLLMPVLAVELCATQFKPLTIEDLQKRADRIVHGTVLSKTVQRDSAGRIYTRVELEVIELWRGNGAQNRFTIVHAGGVLGEKGVTVSGQEQFDVGEELVVFASLNSRGEGVTVGMAQGKFTVTRNKDSSARVSNAFSNGEKPLLLAELKQRVKGGAR
jgi:hypothetical protein